MHSFNQAEMSNLFTEDLPAIKVLECKVDLSHKYINNCSVVHFTTDIDQIQGPGSRVHWVSILFTKRNSSVIPL